MRRLGRETRIPGGVCGMVGGLVLPMREPKWISEGGTITAMAT